MKQELKKFVISFFITNFLIFYYNSEYFRGSILYGLKTITIDVFSDILLFLISLLAYILGYLIFNVVFIFVRTFLNKMNSKRDAIKLTTLIIIVICFIFIANDQLIISQINGYEYIDYFRVSESSNLHVDSTNFSQFEWSKKSISTYRPERVVIEKLNFNDDSTFTIIGNTIIVDRLFLFRKLFSIEKNYRFIYYYKYANATYESTKDNTELSLMSVQIRENKLFINTTFY